MSQEKFEVLPDFESQQSRTDGLYGAIAITAIAVSFSPFVVADTAQPDYYRKSQVSTSADVYSPGSDVKTILVDLVPKEEAVADPHYTSENIRMIDESLGAIRKTLGPDSPNYLPAETAGKIVIEPKGEDAAGVSCYTFDQIGEINSMVDRRFEADQVVVTPANTPFCQTGAYSTGDSARAVSEERLIVTSSAWVTDQTFKHEFGHLILPGESHHTQLDCSEKVVNYNSTTTGEANIGKILEQCKPYLDYRGGINAYMSDQSVMSARDDQGSQKPLFNTYQRYRINRFNQGNQGMYNAKFLGIGSAPDVTYRIAPHNQPENGQSQTMQVFNMEISKNHPLKAMDSTIEGVAFFVDYSGGQVDMEGKSWFDCSSDMPCDVRAVAYNKDDNLYDVPLSDEAQHVNFDENNNETSWGWVNYVDEDSGVAVLTVRVFKKTDDGELKQANGLRFIKTKELDSSRKILAEMSAELLEDLNS